MAIFVMMRWLSAGSDRGAEKTAVVEHVERAILCKGECGSEIYRAGGFTGETINRRVLHMKQSSGLTAGKQPTKRGASNGEKANSFDAAMGSGTEQQTPSPDEQHCLIAEAAYYRALGRGFTPGGEADDWFQAEAELNHSLHMPKTGPF